MVAHNLDSSQRSESLEVRRAVGITLVNVTRTTRRREPAREPALQGHDRREQTGTSSEAVSLEKNCEHPRPNRDMWHPWVESVEPVHFFSGRLLTYKSSVLSTGVDDLRRAPMT